MQVVSCIVVLLVSGASGENDGCAVDVGNEMPTGDTTSLLQLRNLMSFWRGEVKQPEDCPEDCQVGPWTDWSTSSTTCGPGERTRTRPVVEKEKRGGKCDKKTTETETWVGECCPTDCEVDPWTEWSPCSSKCATGTQDRSRLAIVDPLCGGKSCPPLTDSKDCNEHIRCKCKMGPWTDWTDCSKSCGPGERTRSRKVEDEGLECDEELTDTKKCELLQCCPEDCTVSGWTEWSTCSSDCKGGTQFRKRTEIVPAQCGGKKCPPLNEDMDCNKDVPCKCKMGPWEEWGPCSKSCEEGERTRHRKVAVEGDVCDEPTEASEPCTDLTCCPKDCDVGEWSEWGECDSKCQGGKQVRSRKGIVEPQCGGKTCPPFHEDRDCNKDIPCKCKMGPWEEWGPCSVSCEEGERTRSRKVLVEGVTCDEPTEGKEPCTERECCPTDCEVSAWNEWSKCSSNCKGGTQTRSRTIVVQPQCGGHVCPPLEKSKDCNDDVPCKCKMGPWSDWSPCSATCEKGTRTRSRKVEEHGIECDEETHGSEECTVPKCCPIPCAVSPWTEWGECSASCEGGTQTRSRRELQEPVCGGEPCPPTHDSRDCGLTHCPEDCCVGDWSEWSACTDEKQSRTREVVREAKYGGHCPELEESKDCGGNDISNLEFKVCGNVKSAVDNSDVPGAKVAMEGKEAVTDATGAFCIEKVPADATTVTATKDGWVDGSTELPPITEDTTGIIVTISKNMPPKDWRIILSWGMTPLDLDARTQFGNSQDCAVSYAKRSMTCPQNQIEALLDQDHCFFGKDGKTSCYKKASMPGGPSKDPKPETTTLTNVDPSTCGSNCKVVFHVSNYMSCLAYPPDGCPAGCPTADTGTLMDSKAEVRVIHGEEQVAFFQLAKGDGKIRYGPDAPWKSWGMEYNQEIEEWWVFAIDVKTSKVVDCKDEQCY